MAARALHDREQFGSQDGSVNTAKYFASVKYAYKVDGVTRQSKTLSPLDKGFDDYYDATKKVDAYPADASGTALVNPADASVAYLESGPLVWNMLLIGLGISIVAMLAEVRLVRIALHPDRKYVAIGEQSWFVFSFLGAFMATGVAVAAFVSVPGMMRGFGARIVAGCSVPGRAMARCDRSLRAGSRQ